MSAINNLKIRTRILLSFTIVLVLMGVIGISGYWGISTMSSYTLEMLAGDARIAEYSARARANEHAMRQYEKDMFINMNSAEKVDDYLKKWQEEYDSGLEKIEGIEKIIQTRAADISTEDRETVKKIKEDLILYHNGFLSVAAKVKSGEITTVTEANKAMGEHKEAVHALAKQVKELAYKYTDRMHAVSEDMKAVEWRTVYILLGFILAAIAVSIFISFFISRNISTPIQKALEFSNVIAKGDFTARIDLEQTDELGQLGKALNSSADSLEKLIGNVIQSSQILVEAVEQISSGNQNLSQRTSEQASSLEEVASTAEEAAATIGKNAENATMAKELTNGGAVMSKEGNSVAVQAISSINEMTDSSKKMAEIISVINDIAFQTNLLALNAAVEAARAGEQGRGFAVVAGEVRNLAQRSGNSAKEIEDLIKQTVSKVERSNDLVEKTGNALQDIAAAAEKTAQIISEIALASQEQRQGINQINVAISELDSMTQQNASLVEETASASEEMANQAQDLLSSVQIFNVRETVQKLDFGGNHKKIHLRAAEGLHGSDGVAKAGKNDKTSKEHGSGNIKKVLADEGFEEF